MSEEHEIAISEGISIIAATNRDDCMENLFANYENQQWGKKELIILLNKDSMDLGHWLKKASEYPEVSVFQLPEEMTLGKCLNIGVTKAKYPYIAKMDDDDYYGPLYLSEAMATMKKFNAGVVGKRTCFMYMIDQKELRLRFPGREMKRVHVPQGATIFTTKRLLKLIPFGNKNVGECLHFLKRCKAAGYKICSSSRYHYAIMRKETHSHTWRPSRRYLYRTSRKIAITHDYKKFVDKHK
ncbi:MAG: glycosyltransferase [Bacillota bacterium]|uniref:glycosyltransferase n=1 Tax=Rossellomorea sp. FM04394 TaxID=3243076 RepID=UPI0035A6D07D